MTGKHEPASKRSFYVSLTTAALRGILVITALVLGVFVLSRAFPTAGEVSAPQGQTEDGGTPPTPESPAPTVTGSPVEPRTQPSPRVEGVVVQVLNGTDVEGLAAGTAEDLEKLGYVVPEDGVGDASELYDVTTIFYQSDAKREGEHLRDTVFAGADLRRSPQSADPDFELTVVLGSDFATAQEEG